MIKSQSNNNLINSLETRQQELISFPNIVTDFPLELPTTYPFNLTDECQKILSNDINKWDDTYDGASLLHYASVTGNLTLVKSLLAKGAHVNIWDSQKQVTPLICAAAHGHLEIVEVLLEYEDCDINAGLNGNSTTKCSALLWAVRRNHPEVVRCLLNHKASQNSNLPYSETPIHAAVISGSPEILRMLINSQSSYANKADIPLGPGKFTPLHLAASGKYRNSLELCKILLEQGNAQVDSVNVTGKSPLHVAVMSQEADIVKLLLLHGANVNAVDEDGKTPLFYAIGDAEEALKCLEILITRGICNVNHQDIEGCTALHFAGIYAAAEAAEVLLLNGADFSIKTEGGVSALSILCRKIPTTSIILGKVFDHAVRATNFEDTSIKCRLDNQIEVDFNCVLPTLTTHQALKNGKDPHLEGIPGSSCPEAFLSSENKNSSGFLRKETAKVQCLVVENQASLLLHPVVHAFLEFKWRKARYILLPSLAFKVILVILFSVYAQLPYILQERINLEERTPTWFKCIYTMIVTMAVLRAGIEVAKILRAPWPQLKTLHPWISAGILLIMTTYLRPRSWKSSVSDPLQKSMAALGTLLAWIDIWMEMGRFPRIGLSIRVFLQVFKTFSSFVLPHFCLLAGFMLSLPLLFPQSGEMYTVAMALTKITRTMAGDITHVSDGVKLLTRNHSWDEIFSHIILDYIYTAYVLIASIVLMNLLIGLAVNDIQRIYAEASIDKLVKQTILLNTLETSFSGRWIKAWTPTRFFFNYINLFSPSSNNNSKVVTFKPFDWRDSKLGKELKMALLNIRTTVTRVSTNDEPSQNFQKELRSSSEPSLPKKCSRWKSAANKVLKGCEEEEDRENEVKIKINELVFSFLQKKKVC